MGQDYISPISMEALDFKELRYERLKLLKYNVGLLVPVVIWAGSFQSA